MSPCCGRPNNRAQKGKSYAERFAYLSSHQKNNLPDAGLSSCQNCQAITSGDPCTVCGNSKAKKKEG